MKAKKPLTPFPSVGYFGPEYFCDRIEETQTLVNNIKGGQSTTLVSIRRMGKTGLIKHVQHRLQNDFVCIYVDILPTESSSDFLDALATAMLHSVPENSGIGAKIWNFVKTMRPVLTFDALSGLPNVSFNLQSHENERHIGSLFAFLEQINKPVLFAIDEFQQILNYPEKNVEAWLRTIIQQLKNVTFIFSGSQPHIINEMFVNPSKPFYRSTLFLQLNKIDFEKYSNFIITKFTEHNKSIETSVVSEMLGWTNVYTYYVQLLCNRVFIHSGKKINSDLWHNEALKLLAEQQPVFLGYRDMLTQQQWKLLKAIAHDGVIYSPTSKDFVQSHQLGSPATVLRSLGTLQKKSLVYSQYNSDGKMYYSVYDVLFQRWIQNL